MDTSYTSFLPSPSSIPYFTECPRLFPPCQLGQGSIANRVSKATSTGSVSQNGETVSASAVSLSVYLHHA